MGDQFITNLDYPHSGYSLTPVTTPTNTRNKISVTNSSRIREISKKNNKRKQKTPKGIQKKLSIPKIRRNQRLTISCPICFEELRTGDVSATMCGHIFCTTCISKSTQGRRRQCPTCRRKLPSSGVHPLYLNMEEIKESKAE